MDLEYYLDQIERTCREQGPEAWIRIPLADLRQLIALAKDDPLMDAGDGAHPAFWRGTEFAASNIVNRLEAVIETGQVGFGAVPGTPVGDLQEKILALRRKAGL